MNILVTGSSGFIGQYLVPEFENFGYTVIPFDVVNGQDFTVREEVDALFRDYHIDVVCHLGAQAHLGAAERYPVENARINILGSINIFEAAFRNRVGVVFHSTGAVLSSDIPQPVSEDAVTEPLSHYGVSKLCAEEYLLFYARRGLRSLRTRFSSVYGIGRDVAPINVFTRKAVNDEPITVMGPDVTRDYTHVSDVVRGVRMLVSKLPHSMWNGQLFNIATGTETRTIDVVNTLEVLLGKELNPTIMPSKKGDILKNFLDISKMTKFFEYRPSVSLKTGIKKLIAYYQDEKNVLEHENAMR